MPVKKRISSKISRPRKSPWIAFVDTPIKGRWFSILLVIAVLVIVFGVAFGTFIYQFVSDGIFDHIERSVTLTAEQCNAANSSKRIITVTATAYSSSPEQTDDTPCITATGYDVCENYALYGSANTIASNFLPLHAIVKIPELYGDELFVVRDRMNPRFGKNNIDIWMPTYSEARRFGSQQVTIEVY
jgi:3D (Asp-Asp-Asp) domain-containing protein